MMNEWRTRRGLRIGRCNEGIYGNRKRVNAVTTRQRRSSGNKKVRDWERGGHSSLTLLTLEVRRNAISSL